MILQEANGTSAKGHQTLALSKVISKESSRPGALKLTASISVKGRHCSFSTSSFVSYACSGFEYTQEPPPGFSPCLMQAFYLLMEFQISREFSIFRVSVTILLCPCHACFIIYFMFFFKPTLAQSPLLFLFFLKDVLKGNTRSRISEVEWGRAQALEAGFAGSNPTSGTYRLCDIGQVLQPVCNLVFSSIKQNNNSILPLKRTELFI